jgi:hypothetical protein
MVSFARAEARRAARIALAVVAAVILAGFLARSRSGSTSDHRRSADVAPEGEELSSSLLATRRVELRTELEIRDLTAGVHDVKAWIPLPADHEHQDLLSWRLAQPYPAEIVTDAEFGNRFLRLDLGAAARAAAGGSLVVRLDFVVERRAERVGRRRSSTNPPAEDLARHLEPDRLVPTDGILAEEARRVVGGAETALEKARRLYDHVVATLDYDKSGDGWGQGDAVYACDVRRGNCTEFHSLLMAEARSVGIPSEFVIGLPLPPEAREGEIPGYHCWAELYLDDRGWMPVDASEAHKRPELRDFFFGGLDADRVELTTGRDLDLPGAIVRGLNFVVHPHVEADGSLHRSVVTRYRFRDLDTTALAAL